MAPSDGGWPRVRRCGLGKGEWPTVPAQSVYSL